VLEFEDADSKYRKKTASDFTALPNFQIWSKGETLGAGKVIGRERKWGKER